MGIPIVAQWCPLIRGWKASLWAVAIVGACLYWAIDNNLTHKISAGDAVQIAGVKGLVAGLANMGIALALGHQFPLGRLIAAACLVGAVGYGVSLALFLLALRHFETARTGAYFSTAPFIGAVISLLLLQESPEWLFWTATVLMAGGVGLHLIERHDICMHTSPSGIRIGMYTTNTINIGTILSRKVWSRRRISM